MPNLLRPLCYLDLQKCCADGLQVNLGSAKSIRSPKSQYGAQEVNSRPNSYQINTYSRSDGREAQMDRSLQVRLRSTFEGLGIYCDHVRVVRRGGFQRRPESPGIPANFQAGRHQSKQKPVETKMLATIRRIFAEIPTNSAEFCNVPPNSAKMVRLVVVSTGGVLLGLTKTTT